MSRTPPATDKPLIELQWDFLPQLAQLIVYANLNEYRTRPGDFYRDERAHGKYGEKKGYAAAYSNHKLGIAADIMLFTFDPVDGWIYEKSTTAYADLGAYWEEIDPGVNVWGGHWSDGNHFSKWYQGRW